MGFSRCVEDQLVAFGCCLLFGRVVVLENVTYSPFQFSISNHCYITTPFIKSEISNLQVFRFVSYSIQCSKSAFSMYVFIHFGHIIYNFYIDYPQGYHNLIIPLLFLLTVIISRLYCQVTACKTLHLDQTKLCICLSTKLSPFRSSNI